MIYLDKIEEKVMKKYSVPALLTLAFGALFCAYIIIDALLRVFGSSVSIIDLISALELGLIAGLGLGLAAAHRYDHVGTGESRYVARSSHSVN
jgi:hypothetical protein